MFRWFMVFLVAFLIVGGVAWHQGLLPGGPFSGDSGREGGQSTEGPRVDLGGPLYPAAPVNTPAWLLQEMDKKRTDRLVLSDFQFEVMDKQDVISMAGTGNKEGQILFIGQEVFKENLLGNDEGLLKKKFMCGDRPVWKVYRPLKEGNIVKEGDMLALIEPSVAETDRMMKKAKYLAAQADQKASEEILSATTKRLVIYHQTNHGNKKVISPEEMTNLELTQAKYAQEVVQKIQAVNLAINEMQASELNYLYHEIRCKIPGESAIKVIYKNPGDGVKSLEPIMQLQSVSRLRAIGSAEGQFLGLLHEGQRVVLEPSVEVGTRPLIKAHRGEITAVATCADNQHFVTGSEDGTVCVWQHGKDRPVAWLTHSAAVRSVACSPEGAEKSWCLVGCADGSIYLWDLKKTDAPVYTLHEKHRDAVSAVAFSPKNTKGAWFATGGVDGQINLWSTADGQLVYPFDAEHGADNGHQGPITSLHFTPQTRLVSAGRDQSLRVWELHEKGARLHIDPITGRGGSVNQLGVSQDGQWMLFDKGKSLTIRTVDKGHTASELTNAITAPAFETLALFSPDDSLLLTAGAAEGRVQLWRTPTPWVRGFEARQFVTTERSPVTCAAFSPKAGLAKDGFVVTGTKDGSVYVWDNDLAVCVPTHEDLRQHCLTTDLKGQPIQLTLVDRTMDSGKGRIGVDINNPLLNGSTQRRFQPGQRLTVVVVD